MEKILITPLVGMGDTLMTTPALRLIKSHIPDCHIAYFTLSASNYQLLKNNPFIDSLWYYPAKSLGFLKGPVHIVKNFFGKYSISLTFYPANRAAYNLFALLSGAPKRIGHRYLHADALQLNWVKNFTVREDPMLHCVEENVRLLSFLGISCEKDDIPKLEIFLTPEEQEKAEGLRNRLGDSKIIGVHTGTSTFKNQDKRRWPGEHFAELINRFPDCHFILFGTKEEEETNKYIASTVADKKRVTVLDNLPLREAIAAIGRCDAFVTNDSGLMHIAAAMNVPTLVFLGPTNPAYIYPWKVRHKILRTGIACSPCFYYSPKPLRCIKNINFRCMSDLTVDMAEDGLMELLKSS
jgi:heptosyltransferase-2